MTVAGMAFDVTTNEARAGAITGVDDALAGHEPIDLGELVARAGLQTRVDRKYVLPVAEVPALLSLVEDGARVLEIGGSRGFAYESVYFDTPDLRSYLLAAHRRRRRFKIRTRTYLDSAQCFLEVKTRGPRGCTVKDRLPYDLVRRDCLDAGRDFAQTSLVGASIDDVHDAPFAPALATRYRRSTLFLPATRSRVTVDTDLCWEALGPGRFPGSSEGVLRVPSLAVVETKTGSTPSAFDRLLWRSGHRPARISKYATGLAALHPGLPSNPWRRTLDRHFSPLRKD